MVFWPGDKGCLVGVRDEKHLDEKRCGNVWKQNAMATDPLAFWAI